MRTHHRLVVAAFFALLLASCGSSSSPSTTTDVADVPSSAVGSDQAAAPDPTAAPDSAAPDSGEVSEPEPDAAPESDDSYESPVAELFGLPVDDGDAMNAEIGELQANAERAIATCMREQGFEYKPVDYGSIDDLGASIDFDGKEFAEEYGFGIATSIDGAFAEAFEDFKDPNEDYLASLSEGELDAYYTALTGMTGAIASFDDAESSEPAGCQGDAYDQAFSFMGLFEQFGDQLDALDESIESDPRIVEANASWASCMFDRGHGYSNAEDARQDFQNRYNQIVSADDGSGFPDVAGDAEEGETVIISGGPILSPETQALVDELAVGERAVATASWDCEQPISELYDQVRIEYELRFVEENGDAVRAAVGG